jgi:indole-3-glycerol phosphate synthase
MYLDKIIDYKKQELEHVRRRVSLKDVRLKADETAPARDFSGALKAPGIRIIAEVKKASPSAGVIRPDFDPVSIAADYEEHGAAAISVLTDEHFFQGSLGFLAAIKKHVRLPLLRKDFTLDAYHLYEARGAEADAVLLIAAVLEDAQLKDYAALAEELGMTALVEVHDEKEMDRCLRLGSKLIGINNRNLKTFKVDLDTSRRLAERITGDVTLVSESGISSTDDIKRLQDAGIGVFLIGETLMREKFPGRKLQELLDSRGQS